MVCELAQANAMYTSLFNCIQSSAEAMRLARSTRALEVQTQPMTELMTVLIMSSVNSLKYESIYSTAVQLGESTHGKSVLFFATE